MAFSIYMTVTVDVLDNWKLALPNQKIHVGDEVTVASTYTKKMSVTGTAIRYLDCKNKDGVLIRYELNRREANRAARTGGTGIVVVMPPTVVDLPAKCRIAVAIDYQIFLFKHVIETNETEEFTLYPKETTSAVPSGDSSQKTNQTPVSVSGQGLVNGSSSLPNTTPSTPTSQSNTSQPSFIERILKPITNILEGK